MCLCLALLRLTAVSRSADDDAFLDVVDLAVQEDLTGVVGLCHASADVVGLAVVTGDAVVTAIHCTIVETGDASVRVLDHAGIVGIDMALGDLVGDAVVGIRAVVIEVDLTVFVIPPATVCVLSDAGVSQTNLAVQDIVVSVLTLEVDIQETGVVECDRTVTDIPVAVLVGNDAFILEVDAAVLEVIPAVVVLGKTGELEVDLTLLDSPPAVFVCGDAGVVALDLSDRKSVV